MNSVVSGILNRSVSLTYGNYLSLDMFTNWLTSPSSMAALSSGVVAAPPDVILEVGPSPGGARFVAHAALLAMHSGYLRSAIRIDENGVHNSDLPVFLTNVTPDQFGPLLTYMYTGFLDLNIENIFGVLLATHVLHMPRALEICRAFLSRAQSEGYLSGSFLTQVGENTKTTNHPTINSKFISSHNEGGSSSSSFKVIRPIASKPSIPNIGFIVPPMAPISFASTGTPFRSLNNQTNINITENISDIQDRRPSPVIAPPTPAPPAAPLLSNNSQPKTGQIIKDIPPLTKRSPKLKRLSTAEKPKRLSELQPIPVTLGRELDNNDNNKIIIDVASCDGPVRFRRVLNDAYGRQPQNAEILQIPNQERSHQSVSFSFHQQMAKNISQRQQQSDESENSDDLKQQQSSSTSNEVYNCVYCKHTFKSQYCYQKHAKRHLNPLSLESGGGDLSTASGGENDKEEKISNQSVDVKREVRPLDMNVQYYPCKTCGSKFPSYYFVHKHRKMCHSNEDAGQ